MRVVEAEAGVGACDAINKGVVFPLHGVGDELEEEGGDVGGGDAGGGERRAAEPPVVGVVQPVRRAVRVVWNKQLI